MGDFAGSAAADLRAAGAYAWGIFALGLAGAILLVVAEFSKVVYITVVTASCSDLAEGSLKSQCMKTGFDRHRGALIVVGLLLLAMSFGAAVGRSRPAALAMVVLGLVPIGIWFFSDRKQVGRTGAIGADFSQAKSHAGKAVPLELIGGGLGIAGGLLALRRRRELE